mmetsp:Transcript_4422/g.5449  ORF Transcript_4422/g.5449 Transcript_4422/m.5449 type:complete len:86 (+) Transcript_4422:315-572(+)
MVIIRKLHRDFRRVLLRWVAPIVLFAPATDPLGDFELETSALGPVVIVLLDFDGARCEVDRRLIFAFLLLVAPEVLDIALPDALL